MPSAFLLTVADERTFLRVQKVVTKGCALPLHDLAMANILGLQCCIAESRNSSTSRQTKWAFLRWVFCTSAVLSPICAIPVPVLCHVPACMVDPAIFKLQVWCAKLSTSTISKYGGEHETPHIYHLSHHCRFFLARLARSGSKFTMISSHCWHMSLPVRLCGSNGWFLWHLNFVKQSREQPICFQVMHVIITRIL